VGNTLRNRGFMAGLSVERLSALAQKSTASLCVEHDENEVLDWPAYAGRWHYVLGWCIRDVS
jgi:hypothetical protein